MTHTVAKKIKQRFLLSFPFTISQRWLFTTKHAVVTTIKTFQTFKKVRHIFRGVLIERLVCFEPSSDTHTVGILVVCVSVRYLSSRMIKIFRWILKYLIVALVGIALFNTWCNRIVFMWVSVPYWNSQDEGRQDASSSTSYIPKYVK